MRFLKYPFSSRRKRSNIFLSTLAFLYHLSRTLKRSKTRKTTGTWDCACVNITRPTAILDRCSNLDWNRWHVTLFTSPFSPVRTKKGAFSNVSTFETVFIGRFSLDDRRERNKKHTFSNENALVWMRPNAKLDTAVLHVLTGP